MTTATITSPSRTHTSKFWEHLWRQSGISFVVFAVVAYLIHGRQPHAGASADALMAFYDAHHTRILIATVLSGMAVLNLLWFAAAIRTTEADAGEDGWGAAATASSAVVGVLFLLLITVSAALAFSIARPGNEALTRGLNDFMWSLFVLSGFPRAMLIMSGTFGLWRAKLISNGLFGAGVALIVLGVLSGTTWMSSGFWAPHGAFSRLIMPILSIVWVLVVSRILLKRVPAARAGW